MFFSFVCCVESLSKVFLSVENFSARQTRENKKKYLNKAVKNVIIFFICLLC